MRNFASAPQSLESKLELATNKLATDAIKLPMVRNMPKVQPREAFVDLACGKKTVLRIAFCVTGCNIQITISID